MLSSGDVWQGTEGQDELTLEEVEGRLRESFPNAQFHIDGEGCNLRIEIEEASFSPLTPLQRQRQVQQIFREDILSGRLHALTIQARAPQSS